MSIAAGQDLAIKKGKPTRCLPLRSWVIHERARLMARPSDLNKGR
jgi:hypothetical protein